MTENSDRIDRVSQSSSQNESFLMTTWLKSILSVERIQRLESEKENDMENFCEETSIVGVLKAN